jgi:uncharacterized protein YndB with AHSA1/START domain
MIQRHVVLPVEPEQVWEDLTDPEAVGQWMGTTVEWKLSPGGAARFLDHDGTTRLGRVEEVVPGRRLRFQWWPDGQGEDAQISEVTYDLEPDSDGTALTVTECPVFAEPAASVSSGRQLDTWTAADDVVLGAWSRACSLVGVRA